MNIEQNCRSGASISRYNDDKIRYVSVISTNDGSPIADYKKRELTVDPDLIAGFITAVIIFAKTPVRTIRKAAYDILIEVGEKYIIITVCDPVPDESPYRDRMKRVLWFIDNLSLSSAKPSMIREIASQLQREGLHWVHNHLLQSLLTSLGMSWLGFLDGNPKEHLEFILSRVNHSQAHTEIQDYVAAKICEQIDAGGTTIGFDIDKMAEYGPFAVRMDQVLASRQHEMKNVEVIVDGNSVDLRNLWLTAYGHRMLLEGMDVGLVCDSQMFNKIQHEFSKVNITLRTTSNPPLNSPPTVSKEMRDYIWEIASHGSNPISSVMSKMVERLISLMMK